MCPLPAGNIAIFLFLIKHYRILDTLTNKSNRLKVLVPRHQPAVLAARVCIGHATALPSCSLGQIIDHAIAQPNMVGLPGL